MSVDMGFSNSDEFLSISVLFPLIVESASNFYWQLAVGTLRCHQTWRLQKSQFDDFPARNLHDGIFQLATFDDTPPGDGVRGILFACR